LRGRDRTDEQALVDGLFVVPVTDRPRGLLAHHLDGRFMPMDPRELQGVVDRLLPRVEMAGVDHVLGVPEGGTVVAFAFAQAVGLPLVLSSRMVAALPDAIYFEEPHSVTADRHNYIYGLRRGDHVIIVDDEVTTGRTLLNAVRALRGAGITVDQLVVLLASDDPATAERFAAEGITIHAAWRMPIAISDAIVGSVAER
jgi:adenine phosphoribosyltransferase